MEELNRLIKMIDKEYEDINRVEDPNKKVEVDAFNRLSENLKNVPSILYFNPYIPPQRFTSEIEFDILWLYPKAGLLIIEVKAWDKEFIENLEIRGERFFFGNRSFRNPVIEAKRFKDKLMDFIKRKLDRELPAPVEYVIYFPKLSRKEYRALSNTVFKERVPEDSCIFKNDRRIAEKLIARLRLHQFTVDEEGVIKLRRILFPGLRVAKLNFKVSEEEITLMDVYQEGLLYKHSRGITILRGAAGSGKTVVLIGKAIQEKFEHPEKRILFLTYTNSLANEIKAGIKRVLELEEIEELSLEDFEILTVDSLISNLAEEFDIENDRHKVAEFLREKPFPVYDVILCDESQDFTPEVFTVVKALLKENGLLIFGIDETQRIYDGTDWRWKDVGIEASGRNVTILRRSYRNPGKIVRLAVEFLKRDPHLIKELKELDSVVANGEIESVREDEGKLEFYEFENEFIGVAELVGKLVKVEGIHYGDIFILTAFKNQVKDFFNALSKKIPEVKLHAFSAESKKEEKFVPEDKLVIMPYKSSKGLERGVVIVTGVGHLPYTSSKKVKEIRRDRRTLYVAMTRAQKRLIITSFKGRDNGFAKEIKELVEEFSR
ncbi:3'-5' exonuclease [Phorcysia thermohydrogeniphila]|uniref:Superfamily I DNA and RNA helicase n=1 Tax=Phorcysia thermohydrogeniphila TaxID=936138 RepID=A0A4R1GH50_9BACT|nr:nuclease-related domain-containing DEAD/DEAH box helicase [Phorcysia thermohydrogeniphila]TCK06341.1 superfamily I DNA and RNA helicase [Phorcysia thermohydrogeniphila]